MDYHVVAYTNYELVGLPLHKLWASFSISQVGWLSSSLKKFRITLKHKVGDGFHPGDSILHKTLVLPLHLSSAWGEIYLA